MKRPASLAEPTSVAEPDAIAEPAGKASSLDAFWFFSHTSRFTFFAHVFHNGAFEDADGADREFVPPNVVATSEEHELVMKYVLQKGRNALVRFFWDGAMFYQFSVGTPLCRVQPAPAPHVGHRVARGGVCYAY